MEEALSGLQSQAPSDPRVLWRWARVHWVLGYLAETPEAQTNHWETGREFAYACLMADPEVAAGLKQTGWLLSERVLATTVPEQRPCLAQAAANGFALVELRGAGAQLDVEASCAMVARAGEIVGAVEPGLMDWLGGECAWWASKDAALAEQEWRAALGSGNGLYALSGWRHVPEGAWDVPESEVYSLENGRAKDIQARPLEPALR